MDKEDNKYDEFGFFNPFSVKKETENDEVLNKIRAEIEHIGKATPLIGTNTVIEIINKYKTSPTGAESEE